MIKKALCMWAIAGGLLLTGCSHEKALDPLDDPTVAGATPVRFSVSTPQADGVILASMRAGTIQTESEIALKRLDFYQFSGEEGSETLEQIHKDVKFTAHKMGASTTLLVKTGGVKTFLIVANNLPDSHGESSTITGAEKGTPLKDFLKLATKELKEHNLQAPLLMTGRSDKVMIDPEGKNDPQTAKLTRIVSRLDLKNYEPKLTIERVRLEGATDRSYVFAEAGDGQLPADTKTITLPTVTLPTEETADGKDPAIVMKKVAKTGKEGAYVHYKHILYPYVSTDASQPRLVIEGKVAKSDKESVAHVFVVPLKLDKAEQALAFARNHLYTVVIKRIKPNEIDVTLRVNAWTTEEVVIDTLE